MCIRDSAEAFNSLFKAELVRNKGPWRDINHLEVAVAEYVDWFTTGVSTARSATSRQSNTSSSTQATRPRNCSQFPTKNVSTKPEGLRPAEWWSFLDTVQVSYLIMLP